MFGLSINRFMCLAQSLWFLLGETSNELPLSLNLPSSTALTKSIRYGLHALAISAFL